MVLKISRPGGSIIYGRVTVKGIFLILLIIASLMIHALYATERKEGGEMELSVQSTGFSEGEMIPVKYTCDGEDVSPPLQWSAGPDGTRSYAVIADDPDAPVGTWVHWVIYDIPPDTRTLAEAVAGSEKVEGCLQGKNDFKRFGYGGPCPPGGTHRYYFRVYALDTLIRSSGLTKKQLMKKMDGHILGSGQLMGRYAR